MVEKIRLGYPGKIVQQKTGKKIPYCWFWEIREKSEYSFWSKDNYIKARNNNFILDFDINRTNNFNENPGSKIYTELCLDFNRYVEYFEWDEYKSYMKEGSHFLVPISLDIFEFEELSYLEKAHLPEDLLDYIRKGNAKVLFFCVLDPYFIPEREKIVSTFCRNNLLGRKDVRVLSSNFSPKLSRNSNYFTLKTISYFSEDIWFSPASVNFNNKIENFRVNKNQIKKYANSMFFRTFLCLNRREDIYRAYLAGFLRFYGISSYLSLGSTVREQVSGNIIAEDLGISVYRDSRYFKTVQTGYKNLGKENGLLKLDLEPGLMENGAEILPIEYRRSFCTIVSDTVFDWHSDSVQFFSEKVFKPMYCCRPFILVSTPGCLKLLQSLGFQTFSNWWDESYDSIEDDVKRMDAILSLISSINSWSVEKQRNTLREMKSVLDYNAQNLISTVDIKKTLKWLAVDIYS